MFTEMPVKTLEADRSGSASKLHYLLAMWLMEGHFPSLRLIFFTWIIGILRLLIILNSYRL